MFRQSLAQVQRAVCHGSRVFKSTAAAVSFSDIPGPPEMGFLQAMQEAQGDMLSVYTSMYNDYNKQPVVKYVGPSMTPEVVLYNVEDIRQVYAKEGSYTHMHLELIDCQGSTLIPL